MDRRDSVGQTRLEERLFSRLRAGDAEALRQVYERYADDVYRVALWITESPADASDVTHDVFLGLSEAVARFDRSRPFGGWLRTVTVRTAQMRMRGARRRREVSLESLRGFATRSQADATIDRLSLEKALGRLPSELRTVYVLREHEGLTFQEIGEMLGIRENTAAVRLHRARRRLRGLLRGDR